jgi:hypothetical protein
LASHVTRTLCKAPPCQTGRPCAESRCIGGKWRDRRVLRILEIIEKMRYNLSVTQSKRQRREGHPQMERPVK